MIRHCFALVESPDPLAFRYPIVSDSNPQHTSVSSSQVPPEIESEAREDRSPSETADIGAPAQTSTNFPRGFASWGATVRAIWVPQSIR